MLGKRAGRPALFPGGRLDARQDAMLSRPILLLLIAAGLSGLAVASRPARPRADLTVWVFSPDHARMLAAAYVDASGREHPSLVDQYQARTGRRVAVELIGGRGLDTRLLSLLSDPDARGVKDLLPDVVEIEIGSVGLYLRAPAGHVPLLPLDGYLDAAHLRARMAPQRLATWSRGDAVFGLPLDVHPVALVYRRDLFEEAGVDLDRPVTWGELRAACEQFAAYWRGRGLAQRLPLALHRSNVDELLMMLQQRHINLLDADGRVCIDDPLVAQTIAFYATLVASSDGTPPIADDPSPGAGRWVGDLARGERCAALVPDWALADLRAQGDLAAKLRIRPLPRFDSSDSPTATWGGTAAAIPRDVRDAGAAWDLLRFLYASPEAAAARAASDGDVLSAFPDQWPGASISGGKQDDAFFSGQAVGPMLADLARQMPTRIVSPFGLLAGVELGKVMSQAAADRQRGADESAIRQRVAGALGDAAADLRREIAFEKLDP